MCPDFGYGCKLRPGSATLGIASSTAWGFAEIIVRISRLAGTRVRAAFLIINDLQGKHNDTRP